MSDSDLEALLNANDIRDSLYLSETIDFGSASEIDFGSASESPEKFCRICHEDEESEEALFQPCRCRGSMQWVHKECLNHWRSFTQNPEARTNCLECHYRYFLIDRPVNQPTICSRMVKYLSAHPVYFYFLNQIFIIVLTLIIQLIDRKGLIDRFFQPLVSKTSANPATDLWNFAKNGNYVCANFLVVIFWILTFLLNLIFQIKKRWLYLTMFFKFSCLGCSLISITFLFGTWLNPILGAILLTFILQLGLIVHYRFMDQMNNNHQQEILAYSEELDTELLRNGSTATEFQRNSYTLSPEFHSDHSEYSTDEDFV